MNSALPTYAGMAKATKRYPFVFLDFTCNQGKGFLEWSELADFIFDELKFCKSEIAGISLSRGITKTTAKIQTYEEVDVKVRFERKFEFSRAYGEHYWKCAIRGAQRFWALRFLNVPDEICLEELADACAHFAELKSNIVKELLEDRHDSRLSGIPNGNMRALIFPIAPIPDFISIGVRKIRILHRDQVRRCFQCQEEGHIRTNCPRNEVIDIQDEDGTKRGVEEEEGEGGEEGGEKEEKEEGEGEAEEEEEEQEEEEEEERLEKEQIGKEIYAEGSEPSGDGAPQMDDSLDLSSRDFPPLDQTNKTQRQAMQKASMNGKPLETKKQAASQETRLPKTMITRGMSHRNHNDPHKGVSDDGNSTTPPLL